MIPLSCCYLCLPCLSYTEQRHRCIAESKVLVKEIVDNQMSLAVGLSSSYMYVCALVCVYAV